MPTLAEIINNAVNQPTLLQALSYTSMMDTERAVRQALENTKNNTVENKSTGARWETCSTFLFKEVVKAWEIKYNVGIDWN